MNDETLRVRKRAATQAAVERAAVSLALEHGYDNTTVEMICEASMVSQRTFFNYFGSKEGVILGATPPLPSDAEVDEFVNGSGSNIISDLVQTIATTLADRELDPELFRSRRQVIQRTPDLANAEMVRMIEVQEQLIRIVLARFHAQGRTESGTPDLEDEARMVVSLSTGVMHYAMQTWRRSQFRTPPAELLQTSIALVQRVTNPDGAEGRNNENYQEGR